MNRTKVVTIAFSSDAKGFPRNATVVASVLRRTALPVHIKFYCQGFLPPSFESGRLRVEFLRAGVVREGKFPSHVGLRCLTGCRLCGMLWSGTAA